MKKKTELNNEPGYIKGLEFAGELKDLDNLERALCRWKITDQDIFLSDELWLTLKVLVQNNQILSIDISRERIDIEYVKK